MIRVIFFDWNGTLLNDANMGLVGTNNVLRLFDIRPITIKEYRDFFDIPITEFYSKIGISEKTFFENHLKIQETFHRFYEKPSEKCRARVGTAVLLRWLHSQGIKSIILSNHTTKSIERHLKRLKLERYIEDIMANDNILHTGLKDKATRAEEYVKKNDFSPEQILVVGDAPEEAIIARRLGGKSVLISGGWYSEKRLKKVRPDYLISKLDRLVGIIKDMQNK